LERPESSPFPPFSSKKTRNFPRNPNQREKLYPLVKSNPSVIKIKRIYWERGASINYGFSFILTVGGPGKLLEGVEQENPLFLRNLIGP
jgi:hypothetical protein